MPGLYGDWDKLGRLLNEALVKTEFLGEMSGAVKTNAQLLRRNIVLGIRNQRAEWPPIQEATKRRKGSAKILIDSGDMVKAVVTIEMDKYRYFVGIPEGKTGGRGKKAKIAQYASYHEFGMYVKSGGGVKLIKRQFIQPAFDESMEDMVENYTNAARTGVLKLIG